MPIRAYGAYSGSRSLGRDAASVDSSSRIALASMEERTFSAS